VTRVWTISRRLAAGPLARCELHTSRDGNRSIDDDDRHRADIVVIIVHGDLTTSNMML
jgi:hypothetical protein